MPSFFPGGAAGTGRHQHVRWAVGGGTGCLGGPRGLREPVRRRLRHGSSPSGPRYHDATGSEGNRTTSRLRPPSQAHVTPGAADRTSGRPRCRYRSPRRCWLGRRWLREPGRLHRGHGGRRGHPGVAGPPSTPVRQRPPWWAQHLRRTQAAIPLHFTGPRGTARVGGGWVSVAPRVTITTNVGSPEKDVPAEKDFTDVRARCPARRSFTEPNAQGVRFGARRAVRLRNGGSGLLRRAARRAPRAWQAGGRCRGGSARPWHQRPPQTDTRTGAAVPRESSFTETGSGRFGPGPERASPRA